MNNILMKTAAAVALLAIPSLSIAADVTPTTATTTAANATSVATMTNGFEASDIMKADIKTKSGETIGAVQDVLINREGTVVGIVADVGGFLGVGQRDVLLDWKALSINQDGENVSVTTDLDKKTLAKKPAYKPING